MDNDVTNAPTPPPSVVDEAERLLADITPGEWEADCFADGFCVNDGPEDTNPRRICWAEGENARQEHANAAFIASAPRLVRALVEEVRRLDVLTVYDRLNEAQRRAERAEARESAAWASQRAWKVQVDAYKVEADRLRAAIEEHRNALGWGGDGTLPSAANRTLWGALDNPEETTDGSR